MKKIIRTLLAVSLSAALFGCGSSSAAGSGSAGTAKTDEDYVMETAKNFMDAIDAGDISKALGYASADLASVFDIPELEEAKSSLAGIGFSEKSEKEFSDFIDSIMGKVFGEGIRSYKLNSASKVSDEEYTVDGTVEVIDFENALNINFDEILTSDLVNQFSEKAQTDTNAAMEFLMSEIISRMDTMITDTLKNADAHEEPISMKVKKADGKWVVNDFGGILDNASSSSSSTPESSSSSTPAPTSDEYVYDAHGIGFAGGNGWTQLTGDDAQGSTYASENVSYNGTVAQIHFTEQSNPGLNGGDAVADYVNKQLVNEVKTNYESAGYESVESKAVTIDGTTGAWVHGVINSNHIYELDVPVDTGDGNLTMIALLSLGTDETENLFREIVIR